MRWRFWTRGAGASIVADVDEERPRELLTVMGVAERCHVSRQTVYNWLAEGRLRPAARYQSHHGWVMLFDPADVTGLRDRRRRGVRENELSTGA